MEQMSQYQAFKIIHESGLILEKKLRSEMTPEELASARAKSKARRDKRKSVIDNSPSNKGDWAVCTFSPHESRVISQERWDELNKKYPEFKR